MNNLFSYKSYKKWVNQLGIFLREFPSYHESYLLVDRDNLLSYPEETLDRIELIRKTKPSIRVILI